MPWSPQQAVDAVGFVGVALEGHTSWRSLEATRVGFAAIEGRKAFAGVCGLCVRVQGGKASLDRGH